MTRKLPTYWGCSFCGLMPAQVEKIVIGPGGLCICNRCVDVCVAAINGEEAQSGGVGWVDRGVDAAPV